MSRPAVPDTVIVLAGAHVLAAIDEFICAAESVLQQADIRNVPEAPLAERKCQTHGVGVLMQPPVKEAQDAVSDLRCQHQHGPG